MNAPRMSPCNPKYHDSIQEQGFECALAIADREVEFNGVEGFQPVNVSKNICLPKLKRRRSHADFSRTVFSFISYFKQQKFISANSLDSLASMIVKDKSTAPKVGFDLNKNVIIDETYVSKSKATNELRHHSPLKCALVVRGSMNSRDIVKTHMHSHSTDSNSKFRESNFISKQIQSQLQKGQREYVSFEYSKAANHFLVASSKLKRYGYPTYHPLHAQTLQFIKSTYHANKILEYSSQIIKVGLRHESRGELQKALKMYTVAYRMRRDSIPAVLPLENSTSRNIATVHRHPSLAVLLNLLGGIQLKLGSFDEAMKSFEMAIHGDLSNGSHILIDSTASGTKAASMREIASIHEQRGELDLALTQYLSSLDVVLSSFDHEESFLDRIHTASHSSDLIQHDEFNDVFQSNKKVSIIHTSPLKSDDSLYEEMEVYIQDDIMCRVSSVSNTCNLNRFYDGFFQKKLTTRKKKEKVLMIHLARTLNSIANVYKRQGDCHLAMTCFNAALRGMKFCYGENHPNVAGVLGNIGNLLKDCKEYEKAKEIYREVLKIESLRLGFSHHEVMVTMLNIALVEKCQGRYDEAIALYKEIMNIQQNLGIMKLGETNLSLMAVVSSYLADAQEYIGDIHGAIQSIQEAIAFRGHSVTQFHPDIGNLHRKLGTLHSHSGNYEIANMYYERALRLFDIADVSETDSVVIETKRHMANNQACLLGN